MRMKLLPSSFLPTTSASFFCSRLRASSCAFWPWKYSRLALVARSAFFSGRRKLRANPSFTFTSSPIWPSFSTRSSRITCMSFSRSVQHIGKQRHEPRALDGVGEDALFLVGDGRDAAGHDLAALGDIPLQQLDVLVVDLGRVGAGERAGLLAPEERTALSAFAATSTAFAAAAVASATVTIAATAARTFATETHSAASASMPSGLRSPSGRSSRRFLFEETSN